MRSRFARPRRLAPRPMRCAASRSTARCLACHALASDRVGPRHCGLFGRLAGSVPGFEYSAAMKNSKITWDEKTLDRFLAKPLEVVPGSAMTYDGVTDAQDRVGPDRLPQAGQQVGRMQQAARWLMILDRSHRDPVADREVRARPTRDLPA